MKNITKILFGLLLFFMLAFPGTSAPVTTSISSDTALISNSSRAAILIDSSQLTDSNILNNYNKVRATFDYFGYKYDVLPYSTDLNTLAPYQMIVALSPTTAGLVQNYTTFTGKWALILGRPALALESAYHLTYSSTINAASGSNTNNITNANPMMAVKTVVYYSTYDDYILGSGVTSGATTNNGHKLILTYSGTNGSAVILNNGFDQQLVRNFISIADPTAVFVTGAYPYARDLGIVMRYDDLGDDPASGFAAYYNVSNDCTIAAVIHNTQPSDVAMVPYADLIPHSYDHINLSILSDPEMQYQAQMSMSGGTALFGKQPIGFVPPYNNYTYSTTKILNQTGFRYMLVDSGLTAESNAKDLQYYAGGTDPNNQLWLMGYTQGDEPGGYIQQWWIRDFKESRGYFQVLLHTTGDASTDEATRQRIIRVVYNTTVHDSWFIEPADDFFTHLEDAKKVTVSGNTLQVNGSTVAGLVLWQPSGTSNVVLNNRTATIVARNHMAMLPALNNGAYTFNYSSNYPNISAYTNGSLINNGYYDIQNSTMYFSIHDDDEIYNRTTVSLTNLGGTTLYLKKDGANVSSFTPTNGNYTLSNLTEGNYTIKSTPLITPIITWNNPANITSDIPLSNTQLNAQANVPGTFIYDPVAGTYLSPGQHVLYATFTPNDTANYSIASTSVIINVTPGALATNGLVVYYDGNLSGNSLIDLSGNGNTGYATSVTNGTNQSTGANYISFNGVSSKISVSNNARNNVSSPVSIEFIGSINKFSSYGSLVSKYKDSTTGWYLSCSR
ncbi:MAG: polysaccharide deacetylase family protein, partial [Chloroflexota bacterium]